MGREPPRRSFVAINDIEFSDFFANEFARPEDDRA